MIFVVSLVSTIFILLILILLLEYRSRNRRALARRMRYYAGEMDNPEDNSCNTGDVDPECGNGDLQAIPDLNIRDGLWGL